MLACPLLIRAAEKGLSVTLMERLVDHFGDQITTVLTVQYRSGGVAGCCMTHFNIVLFARGRMHQDIMTWPSQFLYEGVLMAHGSVAQHTLRCVKSHVSQMFD